MDFLVPFIMGMVFMGLLKSQTYPRVIKYAMSFGVVVWILLIALLAGCATQPDNNDNDSLEQRIQDLEWKLHMLQVDIEDLQPHHNLATLNENGCQQGAEIYGKMMKGENVAENPQRALCEALQVDAGELPACERFSKGCEVALCNVNQYPACTALWSSENFHSYRELKAPEPSADRGSASIK